MTGMKADTSHWLWVNFGSDGRCQTPLAQGLSDFSQQEAAPYLTSKALLGQSKDIRNTPGGQEFKCRGHSWTQLPGAATPVTSLGLPVIP